MELLIGYLVIINAIGFLLMLADKQKAKKNLWRIPEATLLTAGLLGGTVGCILAMHLARHKTNRLAFSAGLPMLLAIQLVIGYVVAMDMF